MAITAVGSLGTNGLATSNTTITLTNATNALLAGDWIVMSVSSNNTSTTDADNSEVTGVTDTKGNPWQKLGEWTNSEGVAGSGITTSLWMTQVSVDIVVSDMTITTTFTSARANKACSAYIFRSSTFSGPTMLLGPITPDATDASNNFGSKSQDIFVPTTEVLYFRGLGKQANTTTQLTPTTSWTAITNARSSNVAAARCAYGEFIIVNSDSLVTSDPTLAVSGNTAGVFVGIAEGTDTDGETRLTQQHAMVIHAEDDTPVRLTQQHAMVVHAEADTPVRLTQFHLMVIHSKPRKSSGWMGHWI
jgi:hypothetical protein